MKRIGFCVIVLFVLGFALSPAGAVIVFNDGGIHEISTDILGDVEIYDGPSSQPTIVKLLDGRIGDVDVYENSRFEMLGGELGSNLSLHDYSLAEIAGGYVQGDDVRLYDFSELTITGGYIGEDVEAEGNSQVFIYGSDFFLDGMPVGYGPLPGPRSHLEGTLLNGGQIMAAIATMDNSAAYLVPEPASIALLGLGGLGLLRKRKS